MSLPSFSLAIALIILWTPLLAGTSKMSGDTPFSKLIKKASKGGTMSKVAAQMAATEAVRQASISLDQNKFSAAAKKSVATRKARSFPPAGEPDKVKPAVMRHRLRDQLPFWKTFCTSSLVLGWIANGFDLKWDICGPPMDKSFKNHNSSFQHEKFVDDTIAELLLAGSIRKEKKKPKVVSPLGVVVQHDKKRLIFDARYINSHLVIPSFKYEDLGSLDNYIRPNDYLMTLDLSKGYHHVDMHDDAMCYMGFEWKGQFYVWQSLPFGLAPACWAFTKITRELLRKWRAAGHQCGGYIDDSIHAHKNSDELLRFMNNVVLADLRRCGFIVNIKKSMTCPKQVAKYLGMIVDTIKGCVRVPEERREVVLEMLRQVLRSNKSCDYHMLEKLTGSLISLSWAFGPIARMMTMSIYSAMKPYTIPGRRKNSRVSAQVPLTDEAIEDIKFWIEHFDDFDGFRPIWADKRNDITCYTDAAGKNLKNFGAWAGWTRLNGKLCIARGDFSEEQSRTSSAFIELTAIYNTIKSFNNGGNIRGKNVLLKTDNQSVMYIINKAGSHIVKLHQLFKQLWWYCFRNSIHISATWIPRELNEWADFYSKLIESSDIMLNPEIFSKLQRIWGVFSIDLFASYNNHQTKQYYSFYWTPTSSGVDAFKFDWGRTCYCYPPYKLMGKVISHARICGARMCLIIPYWVQAEWWNMITTDGHWFTTGIRDYRVLPRSRNSFSFGVAGSTVNRNFMEKDPTWDTMAILVDFGPSQHEPVKMPFWSDVTRRLS